MKLIKIRLADCPFWFLGKLVSLNRQNPESAFISLDSLSDEDKRIINKSIMLCEIKVTDPENQRLKTLNEARFVQGALAVDVEDIDYDESDSVPEVFSVTVDNDIKEDDEEDMEPTKVDYENAKLLLNNNGNTVKKTIKEISNTSDGLCLLRACLETERTNKKRKGVVILIEQRIAEF